MAFFVLMAAAEAGICIWLFCRVIQLEQLEERRRCKLTTLRRRLDSAKEKACLAEQERDWYKGERDKAWKKLEEAKDEIRSLRLRATEADMERQKSSKPTLAESVREVEG